MLTGTVKATTQQTEATSKTTKQKNSRVYALQSSSTAEWNYVKE